MKDDIRTVALFLCVAAISALCCARPGPASGTLAAENALALVAQTSARDIDPLLPDQPLTAWLQRATGASAVEWKLNPTCGAASRSGLAESNVCPETTIAIDDDQRATAMLIIARVGNALNGVPRLRIVFVDRRDGSQYRDSDRLSDLPNLIGKSRS